MNPTLDLELDRLGCAIDERAQELRAWGESLHTVSDLLELKAMAREIARVFEELADELADRADQIAEDES